MDTETVETWVFTRTVHGATMEHDTWEFHGTEVGALKEYQDILARSWSPFVTFRYERKSTDTITGGR